MLTTFFSFFSENERQNVLLIGNRYFENLNGMAVFRIQLFYIFGLIVKHFNHCLHFIFILFNVSVKHQMLFCLLKMCLPLKYMKGRNFGLNWTISHFILSLEFGSKQFHFFVCVNVLCLISRWIQQRTSNACNFLK